MQSFGEGAYTSILSLALLVPIAYFLISIDLENRVLGRKDTLRNRIIAKIRGRFAKGRNGRRASFRITAYALIDRNRFLSRDGRSVSY